LSQKLTSGTEFEHRLITKKIYQMKKIRLLIPALAILIASCTSADVAPEVNFVGKWQIQSLGIDYKEVGEDLQSETQDVTSENVIIELKEDGSFTTNYKSNENEDFALFPETVATYSVVDCMYIIIKSNDSQTEVPEVKYKFQLVNDELTLSLDKELTRDMFDKALSMNAESLAIFGYTVEEFLNEFFGGLEQYDTNIKLLRVE
jgi:hypothetical protein